MARTNRLRFVLSEAARASCQEQTRASLGGGPRPWAGPSPPFHKEVERISVPRATGSSKTGNAGSLLHAPSVPSSNFSGARMNTHCRVYATFAREFFSPTEKIHEKQDARSQFKLPNQAYLPEVPVVGY